MTRCQACVKRETNLIWAQANLSRAKGLLRRHGNQYGGRYVTEVTNAKDNVAIAEAALSEHVDGVHDGVMPKSDHPIMERVRLPASEQIPEGKAKCPACGRVATVIGGLRLRRHVKGHGEGRCHNVALPEVTIDFTTPEVHIPRLSSVPMSSAPRARVGRGESESSRSDARLQPPNGQCQECDKTIPPGRRLCGRCMARRSA